MSKEDKNKRQEFTYKTVHKVGDAEKEKDKDDKDETGVAEIYQLLALCMGGLAFYTKQVWTAWVCVLFFYSSKK